MSSWQPGSGQTGVTNRPGAGGGAPGVIRSTPGRYNEDMEQLIFRMHQMLIEELDADQISAMPSDERRVITSYSIHYTKLYDSWDRGGP